MDLQGLLHLRPGGQLVVHALSELGAGDAVGLPRTVHGGVLPASVLPPRASDSASELMQSYCGVEALEHASRTPYHITRVWPKCGESLGPISWWLGGVVTCIRYDVELP